MSRWQSLEGGPLMIGIGEVLLVVCSLCYLLWWIITFRPSGRSAHGAGPFLAGAALGGLGGLVLLAIGIAYLLSKASWPALVATIIGGAVVGALLLLLTTLVAHRPVTTELSLIVIWATLQVAVGLMLWTSGVLGTPAASAWIVLTAIATLVALACYLIFYRLAPVPAYRVGIVPLATDGMVAAIFAVIVTLARVG